MFTSFGFAVGTQEQQKESPTAPQTPAPVEKLPETVLAKPVIPQTSPLYVKDSTILAQIELGSPDSLKNAVRKLQGSEPNYSEQEKTLFSIATGMFDILYPLEKRTWNPPELSKKNVYTAVIDSAKKGIYDYNTGNPDFLLLTLPSLVLITTPNLVSFYADAEIALQKAIELNPQTVFAYYLLGILYQRLAMPQKALQAFQAAYTLDATIYPVNFAFAQSLIETGHPKEGYELASKLLTQQPQNIDIIRLCAESAFASEQWKEADQYVSMILQKESNNTHFLLMRIRILIENNEYLKASSLLDAYSKTEKTSRDYLLLRSHIQKEWNKNTVSAAATLQEALRLYPNDISVLLAAAELTSVTGQKISSLSSSDLAMKVLALDPQNEKAAVLLVMDAINKREWKSAYEKSNALLQVHPTKEIQLLHIEACIGYGRAAEAVSLSKTIYQNEPDETVLLMYVRSLIASGDISGARRIIDAQLLLTTISNMMKSNLYYERSRIVNGDDPQLADLRSSLTVNPRNQQSLFALYQFYYNKKDYRKAQYYLKQVFALNPNDQTILKLQTEIDALLTQ